MKLLRRGCPGLASGEGEGVAASRQTADSALRTPVVRFSASIPRVEARIKPEDTASVKSTLSRARWITWQS